jgi:hypothetical protein
MFKTTGYVSVKCAVFREWVGGFKINPFDEFNFGKLQLSTGARGSVVG